MSDNINNDEILNDFEYIESKNMKDITENNQKEIKIIELEVKNLKEHPNNKDILPPLDDLQKNMLFENIKENGFIEPIHVTKRAILEDSVYKPFVLDGNNRIFEIVLKYPELNITKVPAIVIDIEMEDEKDYIFKRNSARRQISKLSMAYIIGNLYNTRKLKQGEKRQREQNVPSDKKKTSELIGEQFKLSHMTIKRYGTFAKHCQEITEATSNTFLFFLLNTVKSSQKEITDLSKMNIENINQVFKLYDNSENIEPEPLKNILKKVNKTKEKKVEKKKLILELDKDKYSKIENKAKEMNMTAEELLNKLLDEL